jgi:RES domain-containing protein
MPARARPAIVPWSGRAYRATSYDVPLWVNANRRSGRWNIARRGCTQYMSLDALAPMAEMLRHENLRTDEEASHYRTTLWQIRVDEGCAVDYSTFEKAEAAGFPPEALVEDDHERCQAEAQWLVDQGIRAILTPSAALAGSTNLTLFGPRYPVPWTSRATLASALPVHQLPTGRPPVGLTAKVRFVGEPHEDLLAHRAVKDRPSGA